MIRLLTIISIFFLLISIDSTGQLPIWLQKVGDGNTAQVMDITRDAKGNIYSTGFFSGTFNSSVGSFNSNGLTDIFISKTNNNGKLEWVSTFGGSLDDGGTGLCIDNAGNLIITGTCRDTVPFGNDTIPGNVYAAKLNPSGNLIWARGIGNNASVGKEIISIENNIFLVGQFSNPFIIGPDTLINYGSTDIFVAQLDSSGIALRGTEIGSIGVDEPFSISKLSNDNILVSGTTTGGNGFSFGNDIVLPNAGQSFIGRYNFITHHWISAKAIGCNVVYAKCDDSKNTYLYGTFTSQVNLDTIQIIGTGLYVSKFDSTLSVQWAKSATSCTSCIEVTTECGLNREGEIFLSGDFVNPLIIGNDTLIDSGGGTDLFVAKISNDGNWINAQQYGGLNGQILRGFTSGGSSSLIIAGLFTQNITIGSFNASSSSVTGDIFIAKLIDTPDSCHKRIEGKITWDKNNDCIKDSLDSFLPNALIKATPGPYYGLSDQAGNYQIYVDSNQYLIEQIGLGNSWIQSCQLNYNVNFNVTDTAIRNIDFYNQTSGTGCAIPWVDIVPLGPLRRCIGTNYQVSYCNKGNSLLANAYIDLTIDNNLTILSSSVPFTNIGSRQYRFNIGTILPNECNSFPVFIKTECSASISDIKCVTAKIYPDAPCGVSDTAFLQRQLTLNGGCFSADSVYFIIKNTNSATFSQFLFYQIFVNDSLAVTQQQILQQGDSTIIYYPSFGNTVRMVVRYLYYEKTGYQLTLIDCGTGSSPLNSTDLPEYDQDLNMESTCNVVVGSFDPNNKLVRPTGVLQEHYVSPIDELEYTINFQNTGNDTAFTVIVYDTLSPFLDISTLQIMSSSHVNIASIRAGNILQWRFENILLADSNIDEPNSHGFVKFKIEPLDSVPDFAIVNNSAAIVFDYNDPIQTNDVFVTLHDTTMICNLPITQFSTVISDTLVQFNNSSTNYDSLYWEFGDGVNDSTFSPLHEYPLGVFESCLIAYNGCGIDSSCETITIVINSTNELSNQLFKLYPNPTNEFVTLDFGNNYSPGNRDKIQIKNALGRTVYSTNINQPKIKLNLKDLGFSGVYLIQLVTDDGKIIIAKKLVLNK